MGYQTRNHGADVHIPNSGGRHSHFIGPIPVSSAGWYYHPLVLDHKAFSSGSMGVGALAFLAAMAGL
jgi:hypothetical protein